ncbi:MAG: citrate synthase [Anaerolineae bacterium]|nr:citrate synthase [Anaerolineae bacterium]
MSKPKLVATPGEVEFAKGMEGVIARETTKSYVNGEEGKLYYNGYSINDLAEHSTFEEVTFVLLYDRMPTEEELRVFNHRLVQYREIPEPVYDLIKSRAQGYHAFPMAILRTAVSMTAGFDEAAEEDTPAAHEREAIKLTSRMATIAAAIGRARQGLTPIQPRPDLSHAANFLYMLFGEEPDELMTKIMDVILITHADHGCNASTFAALVVTSTMADMYSTVTAGISALKGPLHGGANQRVMEMLKEIGSPDKAEAWITKALARKRKIMGFGHRVYKAMDPRAVILKEYAQQITARAGTGDWLQIAEIIEKTMIEKVGGKGIWPNVDFFSGVVMSSMGIDPELFTVIFAVSRVSGWVAHALEQRNDNRIFRPRFVYVGPATQEYVPLDERD